MFTDIIYNSLFTSAIKKNGAGKWVHFTCPQNSIVGTTPRRQPPTQEARSILAMRSRLELDETDNSAENSQGTMMTFTTTSSTISSSSSRNVSARINIETTPSENVDDN